MKVETIGGRILAATIVVFSLWTGTASGETNTYKFDPDQSTVIRSFFTSDTYPLIGAFQLTVDANTASFDWVDATFSDDPNLQTGDLRELFYMNELVGDVVNDTTIEFELPPGHPVLQSYDIHITVTFQNDQVHLAGYRNPLMVGVPGYTLDAIANLFQILYVDAVNGDDNNDGLSPETAFATIQKGIDSTQNGDLVIVLPGTYAGSGNRDINFKGKAITVRGENGPNNCIVDCEAQGRGFYFHTGENVDSVLEGLTIMNGSIQDMGAGIFCVGASPSIRDCTIRNCSILGTGAGGGISCDGGGPAIINCTIIDNTALEGGGIYLLNCSAMINSCTISRNGNFYSLGGGLHFEDSSPIVTGCTITENNGYNGGGGMYCKLSSPTITDCTITENYGGNGGGGMYCEYGSLSITDCHFVRNEADYGGGGGIMCTDSDVTISRCTFSENGTDADYSDGGGAIHLVRTGGMIAGCSFIDNETIGGSGAGIWCADQSSPVVSNCSFISHRDDVVTCSDDSDPIIRDCSFTKNWGTPIDISGSAPTVANCEIVDNYMMGFEIGGVCSPLIVNCKITGNDWGGVWIGGGSPTIVNCTIADNLKYAGIYCQGGHVNIYNSILWKNRLLTGEPNSILLKDGATAAVTYSDVQGDWPGKGNIDVDPQFINPSDYHLFPASPCINTGENSALPSYVVKDLDGNPRIVNGTVDMGAYEFQGVHTLYVDIAAPFGGDGKSWDTAYNYLQDAMADARSSAKPVEIRVAEGIYTPDSNSAEPSGTGDRNAAFQLINGVIIKGGYAGFGEPNPNARDIELYETILSGDLDRNDVEVDDPCDLLTESSRAENSYHVVLICEDTEVILDGFTITAGNANLEFHADRGGGMYTDDTSPTAVLVNCNFRSNSAHAGGGLFNRGHGLTLSNCSFIRNAAFKGGGVYNRYVSQESFFTNCTFKRNWSDYGGGTYGYENRSKFISCTFTGNRAGYDGGGMYNYSDNNYFPTLINCTVSGNFAPLCGGIYNTADDTMCNPTLTNCVLWGNLDNSGMDESAQLYFYYGPGPIIHYCCVQGWTGQYGGIGNIGSDPLFVDSNGTDNIIGTDDDNLRLLLISPCIDTGDPSYTAEPDETDLDGNPRVIGGRIDMGAYEFQGIQILYVDDDAAQFGDGGSWATAFNYLQDALFNALPPAEIRVAQGIYKPHLNTYSTAPPSRTDTFQLKNGVTIKGGYAGLGQPDPNVRDIKLYKTILSGDLTGNDVDVNEPSDLLNEPARAENSYNVVTGSGTDATALLDGFTITAGNANSLDIHTDANRCGGGVYIHDASPTIDNCTFIENSARYQGGGLYSSYHSNPILNNCTFTRNYSKGLGGGTEGTATFNDCIFIANSARDAGGVAGDVTIANCVFRDNRATKGGGGLYGTATLTGCVFVGNSAGETGGAACAGGTMTDCIFIGNTAGETGGAVMGGGVIMTNCMFSGNQAGQYGGAIYCYQEGIPLRLANCTLYGNSAGQIAGGIYIRWEVYLTLNNCILWQNRDPGGVGESAQVYYIEGATAVSNHSCIQGWTGDINGTGNIDADPCFIDPGYWDANGLWVEGDYHLLLGSPCINTGDPDYIADPDETDLDGNPRVIGGRIDMGAYEFWGPIYVDDDAPNDPGPGDPGVGDPLEYGTETHPFDTIQEAVNMAIEGYTVLVRQGSYFELGTSKCIDFLGKNITLTSADPTDWDIVDNTIVRGYVQFSGPEGPNCKFTGFRISSIEGAIYGGNHTHATISHCNISGNGPCGATVIRNCDGIISNCLITDNTTFFRCGVFPVISGCNGLIKNCTIANNESGLFVDTATIENCIIYNNIGSQLAVTNGNKVDISYSNVQNGLAGIVIVGDGHVSWGPGNIDTDPCFIRLGYWIMDEMTLIEGDYHLGSEGWRWNTDSKSWTYDYITSRCIDAGNPGSPLRGELMSVPRDPDNVWGINLRINMGAFGGTSQASMPPHDWALLADLNNDGTADFVDFAYQAQDWLTTAPEQPGDLNRDGVLNTRDLALLAEEWLKMTVRIE